MSNSITDTFTISNSSTYNNSDKKFITYNNNNSNNITPVANTLSPIATTTTTTFLNDSWQQIEKSISTLKAKENWNKTWLESSIATFTSSSISSLNMMVTESNSINFDEVSGEGDGGGNLPVISNIIENLFGTTTMSLFNVTSMVEDIVTTTETPYVPYVMRPETYIVPVLFAIIFIVGVVGNGTLIVVFLTVRQMRNVPNTYIFSLALADLLVIVTTVPLTSTVYTVDSWPWGSFLCTLSEFFKDVSIGVSVFTLTALSGDRYFAIVDPLRKFHAHGGKRATNMTIAIALSIWLLAILCALPALIATHVKHVTINSRKSFSVCYPFPEEWGLDYAKTMVLLRFLVYYAIPLVIIGVFYALIARHLMYAANVPGEMHGAIRQVRARRKVALTVLAFVVIFGICFLPSHVFMLWFYYWPTAQEDYNFFWHVLRIVGFCMSFANSCANPVALYFVSGAFRKHFNRLLFCEGIRNPTKHRETSLTASRRYYNSRRSCFHQSTLRGRLQETTITMLANVNNPNNCNNMVGVGNTRGPINTGIVGNCTHESAVDVALTSDYCHQQKHSHQLM
ncbi:CCHamide-1 receptor isoform 2-T3 [Cochliomyia hominivorax]